MQMNHGWIFLQIKTKKPVHGTGFFKKYFFPNSGTWP